MAKVNGAQRVEEPQWKCRRGGGDDMGRVIGIGKSWGMERYQAAFVVCLLLPERRTSLF